jgi:predicted MFS family arabinose efflux permease
LWKQIKSVAYLFPGMFAQTFAVSSLLPNFSLYVRSVLAASGAVYSAILATLGAGVISLLIPAGHWVDRRGKRPFLVSGLWTVGVVLGLYPLGMRGHLLTPLGWTFATVAVLGMAYAIVLPAWNAVLDGSIAVKSKATLWGVFMTVEGLGSACGPVVGGWVWEHFGPLASFWLSGGVVATVGLAYLFLPVESADMQAHKKSQKNTPPSRTGWPSRDGGVQEAAPTAITPLDGLGGKQKT